MTKPENAEYIKEIIDKTNGLGYLDIQGNTLKEKQESFKSLIQKKRAIVWLGYTYPHTARMG